MDSSTASRSPRGDSPLCLAVLERIDEQLDRTGHLIALVPGDATGWKPPALPSDARSLGELLGHLLECLGGLCAALDRAFPGELPASAQLRQAPVNHCCAPPEARARLGDYEAFLHAAFAQMTDADLRRPICSRFVPEGEPLLGRLLVNLEHWTNHKHELFTYLKLRGQKLSTPDLYRFR